MTLNRRDAAARLRAVLEVIPDPLVTVDEHGSVIDWNVCAESAFGWSAEEAQGRSLATLIFPEGSAAAFERLLLSLSRGEHDCSDERDVELIARHKDGSEVPVELRAGRASDGGERVFAVHISTTAIALSSISQWRPVWRAIAADKLQEAATLSWTAESFEEALRKCLSILCEVTRWPVGHVWLPTESGEALISTDIWHISDDRELPAFIRKGKHLKLGLGEGFAGKIWKSGEPVWVTDVARDPLLARRTGGADPGVRGAFGFPVFGEGRLAAIVEFFSDQEATPDPQLLLLANSLGSQLGRIIERQRWDQEKSRLAAIVDSSHDAIIGRGLDGVITSWNRGAEEIYGYSAEEAIGQTVAIIVPLNRQFEDPEIRAALRAGRRLREFETIRRRKDGRLIDVSVTVSPIADSENQVVGTATIERDVTLRKRREEELEQARDAAEAANRAKNEFLANVSHELRTPMNAILGMVELSLDTPALPDSIRDFLTTAQDSARVLMSLLDDLLDFSRAEVGGFALELEPFSIRRTIDEAMRALSLRAHERGIELACHVHREVPHRLKGDARRLRQIVMNLAGNAIKFTEQGEVVVRVNVSELTDDEVVLALTVSDTGIGIAPADHERIFAPFTQVDSSFTRRQTGTGLGLAICRELAEKMGGGIRLESELGRGSTFHCTLRFRRLPSESPEEAAPGIQELKSLPVLIVDDNATNRTILEVTLKSWDMHPRTANSAQAALELIREAANRGQPFSLVIVDGLMPDMDGVSLIETLERESLVQGANILMLSSVDRRAFESRVKDLPIAALLEKPISQSMLLDAIMTAFDGPPCEFPAAEPEVSPQPLTVLVAEDTPANQKVVRAVLERRGHFVEIAQNGREAIERVQKRDYDVVLMDVQMPTMDGFQATAAIRNLPAAGEVPIIAMTAHALPGDRERCLQAGMNGYVSKPINSRELIALIERSAGRGRDRRSEPAPQPVSPTVAGQVPDSGRQQILNLQAAQARVGNDEQLLAEMAGFFLEDAPALLQTLQQALAAQHLEEAARAAHSIKGLALNFDGELAARAAEQVESAASKGRGPDAVIGFPRLEQEVNRLIAELQSRFGRKA